MRKTQNKVIKHGSNNLKEALEKCSKEGLHIICNTKTFTGEELADKLHSFVRIIEAQKHEYDYQPFNASLFVK